MTEPREPTNAELIQTLDTLFETLGNKIDAQTAAIAENSVQEREATLARDRKVEAIVENNSKLSQSINQGKKLFGVGIVCLLLLLTLAGLNLASNVTANRQSNLIKDCTETAGQCFQQQLKQTADNRFRTQTYTYIVTWCDVQNDNLAKFQECVATYAPAGTPTGTPSPVKK